MSVSPASSYHGLSYYGNRAKSEVHHVPSKTANCQLNEIRELWATKVARADAT